MADDTTEAKRVLPDFSKMPADQLIDQYVRLRDRIKQADDEYKKKMEPVKDYLMALNNNLLAKLNEMGGESISTTFGTAYRTERKSASLEDPQAFRDFVVANEMFEMLDLKANVTAVEDYTKEYGGLPPGVKFNSAFTVGVRRAGDK